MHPSQRAVILGEKWVNPIRSLRPKIWSFEEAYNRKPGFSFFRQNICQQTQHHDSRKEIHRTRVRGDWFFFLALTLNWHSISRRCPCLLTNCPSTKKKDYEFGEGTWPSSSMVNIIAIIGSLFLIITIIILHASVRTNENHVLASSLDGKKAGAKKKKKGGQWHVMDEKRRKSWERGRRRSLCQASLHIILPSFRVAPLFGASFQLPAGWVTPLILSLWMLLAGSYRRSNPHTQT